MNDATAIPLHGEAHAMVQALLPWYTTLALDPADRQRVEAHLAECSRCQADLAWERQLHAAHVHDERIQEASEVIVPDETITTRPKTPDVHAGLDVDEAIERGLARLHRHIDALPPAGLKVWLARLRTRWQGLSAPALRIALRVQFAVIALLVGALVVPPLMDRYHALGAASGAVGGSVLVMFRADATEPQIRAALQAGGARVVDGPTPTGAYVLAVPLERQTLALQSLRADPIVSLAQPLAHLGSP